MDWSAVALLLMTLPQSPGEPSPADPMQFAQVMIREQILIRVPARIRSTSGKRLATPIEWDEKRGPKCVQAKMIAGATLLSQNSFDLVLRDRSRIRAKLGKRCPALDYYYGFYIRRPSDGQICADRDMIRSRMGGQCEIEKFRTLTARARR